MGRVCHQAPFPSPPPHVHVGTMGYYVTQCFTIYICVWVELCSSNSYAEALTPNISEDDLIWREGLYRGHQVKMRSLGWALVQYDQSPYKQGRLGDRHTQREEDVKTQGYESHLQARGERGP